MNAVELLRELATRCDRTHRRPMVRTPEGRVGVLRDWALTDGGHIAWAEVDPDGSGPVWYLAESVLLVAEPPLGGAR